MVVNQKKKLRQLQNNAGLILLGLEKQCNIPRKVIVDMAIDMANIMIDKAEKISSDNEIKLNIMGAVAMMLFASQISLQIKIIQNIAEEKGITEDQLKAEMLLDMDDF